MIQSRAGEDWRVYLRKDKLSWYDPARVNVDYLQRHAKSEWIRKILHYARVQPAPGVRILEAGCGTAIFGLSFGMLGFAVDAFDYNEEALTFARELEAKALKAKPGLRFRLSRENILNIASASDTYDLVFNQAVLEYFCDASENHMALSEMVRVIRPSGYVAVIVQHTAHPFRRWWEWLGWPGYIDQPSVTCYTPSILFQQLREAGLVNVRVDGINPWKAFFFWPEWYRHWPWTHTLVYLVGQLLSKSVPLPRTLRSFLAVQIIGIGQKP